MSGMPIWRDVFLEIALRAIKKIHFSHTPWMLKKQEIRSNDLKLLNENEAIFTARETTVADEISNEFIYSTFTHGLKIEDENGKDYSARYYEINREVYFNMQIKGKTKECYVDLITRRWEPDPQKNGDPIYKLPQLIELKRYSPSSVDIANGNAEEQKENIKSIKKDIKKLQDLYANWSKLKHSANSDDVNTFLTRNNEHPLLYVLTWGRYPIIKQSSNTSKIKDKENIIREKLRKDLGKSNIKNDMIFLRWSPLIINDLCDIDTWLWLALIEIAPTPTMASI